MASNDFINECKTPAYEDRLGKITIDGTEYNQGNKLTSLTLENNIYNNGSIIGSTYTKSLKFSLIDVNKDTQFVGKKALPSVGVKYPNNTTEYIDLDEFTLEELNDEQTKNFTDITGYDALCDIDKPFTYTLGDGTHTVLEYWNNLVESLGLETETTSFTNDSIIIPANPFVNNESNRTVLSEIEKVSCTFAKVEKRTRTVEGVTQTYHVINLVWFDENHEETTTIDGSGTLNNVSRLSDLKLQGNTTQTGTPTPSSPQPINVVSGRQEISVVGKNLYNKDNISYAYINSSGVVVNNVSNNALSDYILVDKNTNYVFSANTTMTGLNVAFFDSQKQFTSRKMGQSTNYNSFNTENNSYIRVWCNFDGTTEMTPSVIESKEVQLEKNETPTTYEAYKGQSYEINLGKNLFDNVLSENILKARCTITYDNGEIVVNATGTDTYFGNVANAGTSWSESLGQLIKVEPNTTYTFSISNNLFTKNFMVKYNVSKVSTGTVQFNTNIKTFTTDSDTEYVSFRVGYGSSVSGTSYKMNIQFEKGSQATSYSPYKTPIELCKINDYKDRIFKGSGVNLFDKDNPNNESGYLKNDGTVQSTSSFTASDYIDVSNYSRISISGNAGVSELNAFYDEDKNFISTISMGTLHEYTSAIVPNNAKYLRVTVKNTQLNYYQVNGGTTVLPYEPYNSKGKWLLHKEIGKVVLNGSETIIRQNAKTNSTYFHFDNVVFQNTPINSLPNGYSDKFSKDIANTLSTSDLQGFTFSVNGNLRINVLNNIASTSDRFKTWLSNNNVIVYGALNTPTTTEITDEELINQLESIRLLKGTNNIFINSGDLSSKTSLTYYLTNPDYEFTTGDYSTLEGSLTKYGPLNSIMLGRENIGGENVVREDEESIALNGEHKILIDAEYFLFNQTLREQAIEAIYDKLDGFEYYDLSLTTYYGKPFLEVGDKIRVNTNEGNVYDTYILSHEFTYDGTFKSKIESPALTEQQEIVKTTESVSNRMRRTEIMVDKANGEITSLTTQTQEIQDDLAQNYYTSTQTNELIQTASTGLTNTFSEAGGNNIFRNTGLWFGATTSKATLLPSNDLYPSEELFMGNEVVYEFWEGVVKRRKEDKASNMIAMVLQNGYLTQEQLIPNGKYTVSFKYNKLIALAVAKVFINDVEYSLNNVGDTEFIQIIEVNSQHINIKFYCSIDDGCEIYDLMVNAGEVKLAYSQNQNETTTDTVNISKGITITSSNLDVKFKADADGIRTLDNNDVEITKFTDTGMKTKEAIIEGKSQIVGTLWQEVGSQTWITRL